MSLITSPTSSAMDAATQTLSMQELCREYMKENPTVVEKEGAGSKLKKIESIFQEVVKSGTDPVTLDPFTLPMSAPCGHVFNKSTIVSIAKTKGLGKYSSIDCPVCRQDVPIPKLNPCLPFEEMMEKIERMETILKEEKDV